MFSDLRETDRPAPERGLICPGCGTVTQRRRYSGAGNPEAQGAQLVIEDDCPGAGCDYVERRTVAIRG